MQEWTTQKTNEVTVDLGRIFRMLVKRIWVIVAVVLIFAIVAYTYSALFITPTYMSTFTAYVSNRQTTNSTSVSDLNASIGLSYLYTEIITSRTVLTEAAAMCGINAPYQTLRSMVGTSLFETSSLIQVRVVDTDPVRATQFAQAIADVAKERVLPYAEGSSMMLVDPPVAPTGKYGPSNINNALVSALVGLVLVCAALIVHDLVNDKVENAEELELRHNVPVIGMIPDKDAAEKHDDKYGTRKDGYGYK